MKKGDITMGRKILASIAILIICVMALSLITFASVYDLTTYKQFDSNIPKVTEAMLYPEFWIKNTSKADKIIASTNEIMEYNKTNVEVCKPVVDLENYLESFTREELTALIEGISKPSTAKRYDKDGNEVGKPYYDNLIANLNVAGLGEINEVSYGIAVRRTELRMFPTYDRLFSTAGDYRIDRLMETAVYPVEPLVILSKSTDGNWYFAQMYNYLAWIPAKDVALTTKSELFNYVNFEDFLVVTAKYILANNNPLKEELSELRFDMGVRLPLAAANEIKHQYYDQNPAGNFVVKVPTRDNNGKLVFDYVLISRSEDVSLGYLPYTKSNIINQAFKLQGERYGWGGMFNGRDCTAFMMDIYRTMGVKLPRNSGEQGNLAAGVFHEMPSAMSIEDREKIFDKLEPGTGLYMSGHAMLYLGKYKGEYYMIHDFSGFRLKDDNGELIHYDTWQVAVTPLSILLSSGKTYMEGLYGAREFILEKK